MNYSNFEYAKENFIEDNYFVDKSDVYILEEFKENGKSRLTVNIGSANNICVKNYDNKNRCCFLRKEKKYGMCKCIDHFIIICQNDKWNLYMFEMKTSIGSKSWMDIKEKYRASYLNILALCIFLNIHIDAVYACTTFNKTKFYSAESNPDISSLKIPLGYSPSELKTSEEEWNADTVKINLGYKTISFIHKKIQMKKDDDYLNGEFNIMQC